MKFNNIIKIIYSTFLGIFEFIVDLAITLLIIYIINTIFDKSLVITIISYIILVSGLTYGINDIIEKYKENKNGN